jgi:glutathione S-transferase
MDGWTLYGAQISYFTGKLRAYLRWKDVPFEEVPASAEIYRSLIVPRIGFPVIPVLGTPEGELLQDSTEIVEVLEHRLGEPLVTPRSGVQRLVSSLLELYGDEWLMIPAMHYRWHRNTAWAMRQFGALSAPHASADEQLALGRRRAEPFAKAAVRLGAEPHMHEAIERSYEALLGELDAHFAQLPYALGTRPSVGDLGLIGPLYAHQYRDPASGELMRERAPALVRWVERMQRPAQPRSGEFLPDDAIPVTLLPVLRRMLREQLPVLIDSIVRLRDWLAAHPGERVPRAIGTHPFELEGCKGTRIVQPYSLWMLQRARDVYRGLPAPERESADALLEACGGKAFRELEDPPRLRREGMSVALAAA